MKKFLKSRWGIFLITILGIIILITFARINAIKPIENVISVTLRPVQELFNQASYKLRGVFVYFKNVKKLQEENEDLKSTLIQLTSENIDLKQDILDSKLIREELEFITSYKYQSVTAKVIGRSPESNFQIIIINKGETDKINKGYPVIAADGVLIGKVLEANSYIAKILLLNDNQSEISAIIQNNENIPGIISGQFGISLKMELIPQDKTIKEEDVVTTSGLEQNIPPNLLIGKIKQVNKIEGELFQEAIIEPSVDYQNLSIVTIILPS